MENFVRSLIKLLKPKENKNTKELLLNFSIIKKMKIGISDLMDRNKDIFLNDLFGSEFTHTSIFFKVELPGNRQTGIIVQYGKFEYTDKDESGNIGFPYEKEGGLMFGEMDDKTFEDNYCTYGSIVLILGRCFPKMPFKNFLEKVKAINGPWNFQNYDPIKKCSHDFVVAALKVIKPGFYEDFVNIKYKDGQIPVIIDNELRKRKIDFDI